MEHSQLAGLGWAGHGTELHPDFGWAECVARRGCLRVRVPQAAMNQMAKNLTCEWAKDGIRAVAVAPW